MALVSHQVNLKSVKTSSYFISKIFQGIPGRGDQILLFPLLLPPFFFFFLLSPPFSHFKTLLSPEFDQPAGRKFALSCPLQKKDSQEYPGRDLHGLKTLYLQSDLNLQSAVTLS